MRPFIPEPLAPSNPYLDRITLISGDITGEKTDAIVSILPQDLEYRGAVNASLLAKAGEKLDEFVLEHLYKPRPGDIYAVPGFNLPARHIFFCILPKWKSDIDREDKYLLTACRKAMELAKAMCLRSVAFPPLAAGRHGYPEQRAVRLILQGIAERLDESFDEVRIVCPDEALYKLFRQRLIMLNGKDN